MKKLVAGAVVAAALGTGLLTATSASADDMCQVEVYIDKYPGVYTGNPIGVETGEYRPYTNCINK